MRKRNQDQEDEAETDDNIAKRIKAMLALLEQGEFNLDNCETAFAVSEKTREIVQILIPKSYSKAVADLIYGLEWRTAI